MDPRAPDDLTAEQQRLLHEGARLFNAGQWFEAHEAWEDLWHTLESGPDKRYIQGLIQLAVTLEHARRGNPRGVVRTFQRALSRFHNIPPHHFGIDHQRLRDELAAFIEPVQRMAPEGLTSRWRTDALPLDLTHAPKAQLHFL